MRRKEEEKEKIEAYYLTIRYFIVSYVSLETYDDDCANI